MLIPPIIMPPAGIMQVACLPDIMVSPVFVCCLDMSWGAPILSVTAYEPALCVRVTVAATAGVSPIQTARKNAATARHAFEIMMLSSQTDDGGIPRSRDPRRVPQCGYPTPARLLGKANAERGDMSGLVRYVESLP